MKTTQECIAYISTHPWLKKSFVKLKAEDVEIIRKFLDKSFADKHEAMKACNRFFLDKIEVPKNWKIITEMISCCITHRY